MIGINYTPRTQWSGAGLSAFMVPPGEGRTLQFGEIFTRKIKKHKKP